MAINTHYKGDDIIIDMIWRDADGNLLPPSALNDYTGKLSSKKFPTNILKEFIKADFEVIDDAAGEVRLRLDRSFTETLCVDTYDLLIAFYIPDVDAEGGSRVEIIEVSPFKILSF